MTFYYEVLDNVIDLDLGLTARMFDGEASLIGATQQERVELDAVYLCSMAKRGSIYPLADCPLR